MKRHREGEVEAVNEESAVHTVRDIIGEMGGKFM